MPGVRVDDLVDALAPGVELFEGGGLSLTSVAPDLQLVDRGVPHLGEGWLRPGAG